MGPKELGLEARGLVIDVPGRPDGRALDLAIEPGQRWGVLGPNGAGKTTLLHTLAGLRPPRAGRCASTGAGCLTGGAARWRGGWAWCSRNATTTFRPRCARPP